MIGLTIQSKGIYKERACVNWTELNISYKCRENTIFLQISLQKTLTLKWNLLSYSNLETFKKLIMISLKLNNSITFQSCGWFYNFYSL